MNETVLPKHSAILKISYWALILFMFIFVASLVNQYWLLMLTNSETNKLRTSSGIAYAGEATPVKDEVKLDGNIRIAGLAATLDLKKDLEQQLTPLWAGLYAKDIYNKMPSDTKMKTIYMTYFDYRHDQKKVSVVLGYKLESDADFSQHPGIKVKEIVMQKRRNVSGKTVLEVWADPKGLNLTYQQDFDIYNISDSWAVLSSSSSLAVQ